MKPVLCSRCLLAIVFGLSIESMAVSQNKLVVEVTTNRDTLLTGERPYLYIHLINPSSDQMQISDPLACGGLIVHLEDSVGQPITPYSSIDCLPNDKKMVLLSRANRLFIEGLRWLGNAETWVSGGKDLLPGKYSIWVETNGYRSNKVQFTILSPRGKDLLVFNKLREMRSLAVESSAAIETCNEILRDFSSSPYIPTTYNTMIFELTRAKRYAEVPKVVEEYLDALPEHPANEYAVNYFQKSARALVGAFELELTSPSQLEAVERQTADLAQRHPRSREIAYAVDYYLRSQRADWESAIKVRDALRRGK